MRGFSRVFRRIGFPDDIDVAAPVVFSQINLPGNTSVAGNPEIESARWYLRRCGRAFGVEPEYVSGFNGLIGKMEDRRQLISRQDAILWQEYTVKYREVSVDKINHKELA